MLETEIERAQIDQDKDAVKLLNKLYTLIKKITQNENTKKRLGAA